MLKNYKILFGQLIIVALFAGCSSGAGEDLIGTYVAETAAARQEATAAIEKALAEALTDSAPPPSATFTLTATATPTETPTPSPTPNPTAEVIVELAQIRGGPGVAYKVLRNASIGEILEIVGRSDDARWLVVSLVLDEQGWILAEQVQVLENIDALVIIDSPPTSTLPPMVTITVINTLGGRIHIHVDISNWFALGYGTYIQTTDKSKSFSIPAGTYTFVYDLYSIHCQKTVYISTNIVWAPASSKGFCASFP